MEKKTPFPKSYTSKGAHILKKMLEDKQLVTLYIREGKDLDELKDRINFAKPVSFK